MSKVAHEKTINQNFQKPSVFRLIVRIKKHPLQTSANIGVATF
jgi:hypothetical protein